MTDEEMEKIERRQNGVAEVKDTPDAPREVIMLGITQPKYPGLKVDPATCAREIAFLREVARRPYKKATPVEIKMTLKMYQAIWYLRGANREPVVAWVKRFIEAKKEGRWMDHHQKIAFDTTGLLRDGLKRVVTAILINEPPHEEWVWFGGTPESFAAMDIGKRRTGQETMRSQGTANAHRIGVLFRLRRRTEGLPPPDEHLVYVRGMELAKDDNVTLALTCAAKLKNAIDVTESSAALAYWLIAEKSERAQELPRFWHELVEGLGVDIRDPVIVVRNKLIRTNRRAVVSGGSRKRGGDGDNPDAPLVGRIRGKKTDDEVLVFADMDRRVPARIAHQYLFQTQQTAWIIAAWNLWVRGKVVPARKASKWPIWDVVTSLPAVGATDDEGLATVVEPRPAPPERPGPATYRTRRRTPGNVARAMGMI